MTHQHSGALHLDSNLLTSLQPTTVHLTLKGVQNEGGEGRGGGCGGGGATQHSAAHSSCNQHDPQVFDCSASMQEVCIELSK